MPGEIENKIRDCLKKSIADDALADRTMAGLPLPLSHATDEEILTLLAGAVNGLIAAVILLAREMDADRKKHS